MNSCPASSMPGTGLSSGMPKPKWGVVIQENGGVTTTRLGSGTTDARPAPAP